MSKNVWCVAETRQGKLVPTLFETLTAGRKIADDLGEKLCVVLMGKGINGVTNEIKELGVDQIYVLEHDSLEHFLDEVHARALAELIEKEKPNKIFLNSSTIGRSLAARTAVLAQTGLASEVTEINLDKSSGSLSMRRPCMGGTMMVEVSGKKARPEMATIRKGVFEPISKKSGGSTEITKVPIDTSGWKIRTRFKKFDSEKSKELDIAQAEIVVSGGYGLGEEKGFEIIRQLAQKLKAAVGASRRAVDLGWIPYRHQVGLTGRTIKPKLYIACGISGQVQHLAGMSHSDTIVAINKDPEAPLMKLANFAVEGDLFEIVPALIKELSNQKN